MARRTLARVYALVTLVMLVSPALARAEPRVDPEARDLTVDWKADGAVTAGALAFWVGTGLLEKHLAPATCRWCQPDRLDTSARDALRWRDTSAAEFASAVTTYALVPLVSLGAAALAARQDGRLPDLTADVLVVAEAVALAGDLTQIVKPIAGRERPFVHALSANDKAVTANPADNNVSFYSGHTSFAFALAVSSGTVASMRGYRLAPLVWAGGLVAAATVGYLRVAADKHYLTDVLAGAAAGAGVGLVVPAMHARAREPRTASVLTLAPLPGGGTELVLALRF
jgi:membrane-associated phospholipid phosphatase